MPRSILAFTLLLAGVVPSGAADPPGVIHYQGVLRDADDVPQDGAFAMVFRFYDTPSAGTEILCDSQVVTVSGGLFSALLGAPAHVTACMGAGNEVSLTAAIAEHTDLYLQVEVAGQTLLPRIYVAAAPTALNARTVRGRDIVADGPMDLYVDAISGSNANDGLTPATARATIQSVLDDLPQILTGDVQIHLADGTYNERIVFAPRLRRGGFAWIRLLGNELSPASVVIDGTGLSDPGENTPSAGIHISDLPVEIAGFSVRHFSAPAMEVSFNAYAIVRACRLQDNDDTALHVENSATVDLSDCILTNNSSGMIVSNNGNVYAGGVIDISNNMDVAARATHGSLVELRGLTSCLILNNDLDVGKHSTVSGYGSCALSNATCTPQEATGLCQP